MENVFLCLLFVLFSVVLWAQQEPHFSLYRYHLNVFNPAYTGTQGGTFVNMSYRSQWAGIEDSPQSQAVSFGSPSKNERIGLGFSLNNDKSFIEKQTQVFMNLSYRLQLNEHLNLYCGIQAGANGFSVNGTALNVYGMGNSSDPYLIDNSLINPNIGVGLYLKHENYFVAVSSPKILRSRRYRYIGGIEGNDGIVTTASDRPHTYLTAGSNIEMNGQWEFVPSFLLSYVEAAPLLMTLNATVSYNEKVDFGMEYNFQNGVGGTLLLHTATIFSVGYAYITSTNRQLNRFSKGTHELLLKIRLKEYKSNVVIPNADNTGAVGVETAGNTN